jgi:hypothetical protein
LAVFRFDDEIEFSWLHYWKIGRLFTLEDASSVIACLPVRIGDAGSVAHQAACKSVLRESDTPRANDFVPQTQ